ncbi:MAG: GatB/YqeY domain-containing protein [Verrucomicrobia bacterium]|nr:GatB/YqeY domain-containing protein [Cytophagales bacterium]
MPLKEQIEADLKKAMLARDEDGKRALRSIKAMILLEETKENATGTLTEEQELKLLTKAAKQRRDSMEIYKQQSREDLASVEIKDLEIIERYLPKQLSAQELKTALQAIIEKTGAKNIAELGKVMGLATKELAGKADGKAISEMVKTLLSS